MNTQSIIESTLVFVAEFRKQFEEMPGATEFLRDCSEDLECGLAQEEKLMTHQKRELLTKAADLLKVISAEGDKSEAAFGNHLRLAMVERLRIDLRAATKRLNEAPIDG